MTTTYRHKPGKDTWHFCKNAAIGQPKITGLAQKPTTGEFCDQCKSKRSNKNCK